MIKTHPRTLGQRFSLLVSASALVFLAACGGGGGSDTSTLSAPAATLPDPVTSSIVKIDSAAGCLKAADADTCNVVATVTTSKSASILVVGGLSVEVGPGTSLPVTLAAPGLGSKTVLLTAKDGTGTDQVVVTIGCAVGLTPDSSTGKCLASASVVKKMAFAIGGKWAIPAVLDEFGYTELRNDTGKTVISCSLPKQQFAPYTLIPGLCSAVSGVVGQWVAVNYDPLLKNITLNPGGDTNVDNFLLASDQYDPVTGLSYQATVTLSDGTVATFFVKEEKANVAATAGDMWRRVNGVDTLIRDVADVRDGGSIRHMVIFDIVVK